MNNVIINHEDWSDHEVVRVNFRWGTYGKNGDQPRINVTLDELSTQHVLAILDTQKQISELHREMFIDELEYRNYHGIHVEDKDHYAEAFPGNGVTMSKDSCSLEECNDARSAAGYCWSHYKQWKRYGDPRKRYRRRKGTGGLDSNGYVFRVVNGVRKLVHRLVIEKELNRPLVDKENVHHINGDRTDNRPCNLELWSTSQPSGQRIEDKIVYAKEILEQYQTKEEIEEWLVRL